MDLLALALPPYLSPTMKLFLSDLFECNINPGVLVYLKLQTFDTANQKKKELLSITQENILNIVSNFHHDSNSFGWGKLTNNINQYNGDPLQNSGRFTAVHSRFSEESSS